MDLTEGETEDMVEAYEALSDKEIEKLAERAQADRDAKADLVTAGSTTGCKLGSRAAEGMVKHSWENILSMVRTVFVEDAHVEANALRRSTCWSS